MLCSTSMVADMVQMSDTPSKEKDKSDFTAREMEIMTKAWTCMTEEPKVRHQPDTFKQECTAMQHSSH
jgi:hypothetical protein